MQREKKSAGTKTETTSSMKVVVVENDQFRIEREIEKNIKKIKSLINKLRPSERQKYFHGLLSHILSEPTTEVSVNHSSNESSKDHSKLSVVELTLIQELSVKMEQLYRTMDHDPS